MMSKSKLESSGKQIFHWLLCIVTAHLKRLHRVIPTLEVQQLLSKATPTLEVQTVAL